MKTLIDYPINFPYNSTQWPYSPSNPHRGEDRACPAGTPIVVNGTELGLVGTTGDSTGNHCHIDKNKALWATSGYVNPSDWNSITGEVIFAEDAGTAGLTVVVEADNGYFYRFLHMSKITAKVGQKVGQLMVDNPNHLEILFVQFLGRKPTASEKKAYLGKSHATILEYLYKRRINVPGLVKTNEDLKKKLANVDASDEGAVRRFFDRLINLIYKK